MRRVIYIVVGVVAGLPVQAADKLFASPETSNPTAVSGGASLGKTTLALAVVLAFVFVAAWVMKKTRQLQLGKTGSGIEVVSQVALGAKERAVLLKVGETHVLVGVTPAQVNALHVLPAGSLPTAPQSEAPVEAAPATSFQAVLKRSLGL